MEGVDVCQGPLPHNIRRGEGGPPALAQIDDAQWNRHLEYLGEAQGFNLSLQHVFAAAVQIELEEAAPLWLAPLIQDDRDSIASQFGNIVGRVLKPDP
jgi:hypothetical protein